MNKQRVKLPQIEPENAFRNEQVDTDFELELSRNGLNSPLLVEKVNNSKYILVEGYRRYKALERIGRQEADCMITDLTSPEERLLKRLSNEFHTKKRTAYQVERMINELLSIKSYKPKELAALCTVSVGTINKYMRGRKVNPEWVKLGEEKGLGRHGLTDIHHLKNINKKTKEYIFELYKEKKITSKTISAIHSITKVPGFRLVPEKEKIECIEEVAKLGDKDKEQIDELVYKKRLNAKFDKDSHQSLYNIIITLINRIESILQNPIFVKKLSSEQNQDLKKRLGRIRELLDVEGDETESED